MLTKYLVEQWNANHHLLTAIIAVQWILNWKIEISALYAMWITCDLKRTIPQAIISNFYFIADYTYFDVSSYFDLTIPACLKSQLPKRVFHSYAVRGSALSLRVEDAVWLLTVVSFLRTSRKWFNLIVFVHWKTGAAHQSRHNQIRWRIPSVRDGLDSRL